MKILSAVYSFAVRCVLAGAVVFAVAAVNVAFAFDWKGSGNWETVTVEEVQAWIKAGADVNARDEYGITPLYYAAWNSENLAIILALIEAGADVGTKSNGWTPLHVAAVNSENPTIMLALIAHGADLNSRTDKGGSTPLELAKLYKNNAIVAYLSNPDKIRREAEEYLHQRRRAREEQLAEERRPDLHKAVLAGDLAKVLELLKNGADVNQTDEDGKTASDHAVQRQNKKIFKVLRKYRKIVEKEEERRRLENLPALHKAVIAGDAEQVRALLAAGADVNEFNDDGNTAVDIARQYGQKEIFQILHEHGGI